jgi:hypothetical protein
MHLPRVHAIGFLALQLEKAGIKREELAPHQARRRSSVRERDDQDLRLAELERELNAMNANEEGLEKNMAELAELRFVLKEASAVFLVCVPPIPS